MRNLFKIGTVALATATVASLAALSTPTVSTAAVSVAPAAATFTPPLKRDWCIRSGTGELRNLWLTGAGDTCPAPFWGPVKLGERGPAGPAGPAGASGDNAVVIKTATVVLDADHATATATISGMPGYIAGAPETYGHFESNVPAGVSVSVATTAPAAGATTRTVNVSKTGTITGTVKVSVTVWALAVKLPA